MSDQGNHVNRREFIVTGSLAVAGLTMPGIARAASKSRAAALPLNVGFLAETPGASLQSAQDLLTGDPTLFSRGARFSFRGMQPFPGEAFTVFVDVNFHTIVGDLPFFAFTHTEDNKKQTSNSSPSTFLMGVPTQGTIDFSVRARRASAPEEAATVSFAVNSASNALKLNRGAYFFAFTNRSIDWTSIRLAGETSSATFASGGKPLLLRTIDGHEVNFDYVVMTVRAGS